MKTVAQGMTKADHFNPREFGAQGDGMALDTPALQAAIDACAQAGGGTVTVPAGQYLTGTIFLRDDITLNLESGAVLLGSQDPADYPLTSNRWEGRQQTTHSSLIAGNELKNIALVGRGTINGQGETWWRAYKEKTLAHPRPRLIGLADCSNVLIEGITLLNSPAWTVNPVRCENVRITGLTIINPPELAQHRRHQPGFMPAGAYFRLSRQCGG